MVDKDLLQEEYNCLHVQYIALEVTPDASNRKCRMADINKQMKEIRRKLGKR